MLTPLAGDPLLNIRATDPPVRSSVLDGDCAGISQVAQVGRGYSGEISCLGGCEQFLDRGALDRFTARQPFEQVRNGIPGSIRKPERRAVDKYAHAAVAVQGTPQQRRVRGGQGSGGVWSSRRHGVIVPNSDRCG